MKLYLECKPDQALVKSLGIVSADIEHCNDKGRVCNKLNNHLKVKGLIDEDLGSAQPTYLKNLVLIENKYNIQYFSDSQKNNILLILQPRLEEWIINISKTSGINIKSFGLPDNPKELHSKITFRLPQFNKLLEKLLENKVQELIYLKTLLHKKL